MEGVGALGAHARRAPCRHHVCALRCLSSPDPCGAQVNAFYHSANPAERSAAEEVLKQLSEHPDAWTRVDGILEAAADTDTKYYGLQVRAPRCAVLLCFLSGG